VPARGRVGAGTGAAVGKLLGTERSSPGGVGYAALRVTVADARATVAAVAVVNAFGDVLDERGEPLGAPRGDDGQLVATTDLLLRREGLDVHLPPSRENTTLVCILTDAGLTKSACGTVARMATAGLARAIDPVFSPVDGDVAFCLAAGAVPANGAREAALVLGTAAGTVAAAAVRDGVRSAARDAVG
jgi:L-aminopeptidase/D-esterase-like protein